MHATLTQPAYSSTAATAEWALSRTSLGWLVLAYDQQKLLELSFGHASPVAAKSAFQAVDVSEIEPASTVPGWIDDVRDRLVHFLEGELQDFSDVPIATSHLTPLGKNIIARCRQIGWGKVLSYKGLAEEVGRPGASRAVGNVMASNRFPLVVPCHRVVGSGGGLGGYSAPGGLQTKKKLLKTEGSL